MTLREQSVEEIIDLAVAAGLEGIEWGADRHVLPGDLGTASTVARRCADVGVTCASYGSYLFAPTASAGDIHATLDTAAALGSSNVRVWTDWVGPDPALAVREAIHEQVRLIAEAAADRGMTVSLEFHPGTLTDTAASTLAVLDAVGAPNLFTYWQPPTSLDAIHLLASWRTVRIHVAHVHVFRWRANGDRLPLAEGADLWPAVLAEPPTDRRWRGERFAFLEFVRRDDPLQLLADARVLRGWLGAP